MAEEYKIRKNYENLDSLKEKLVAVTSEIDAIKSSFAKSTEDLSRIQSMLSVGHIDDIGGVIEKYESRIAEAEKNRAEAAESSKKYSEELEKEKERLIKLWDAYKNQEEELSSTERRIAEFENRAKTAEVTRKQMESDYTARIRTLEQKISENEDKAYKYDEYKQKCEEFDSIKNNLETELYTLKEENTRKEKEINELNEKVSEIKEMENYAEYKEKYEEVTAEYEREKERLTKLYQLYEETDNECKRLKVENSNWQNWYNQKMDMFNKLFSSAPPVTTTTPISPENPIDNPTIKKKKKFKIGKN
jgi:chromosome segregation ATPase